MPKKEVFVLGVFFFYTDDSPLQPFPLQEAREVHGLLVQGKWSSAQIITNYSAGGQGERKSGGEFQNNKVSRNVSPNHQKTQDLDLMPNVPQRQGTSVPDNRPLTFAVNTNTSFLSDYTLDHMCVCVSVFILLMCVCECVSKLRWRCYGSKLLSVESRKNSVDTPP